MARGVRHCQRECGVLISLSAIRALNHLARYVSKYVQQTSFLHCTFTYLLTKDLVHRETSGLDTLIQPVLSSSSLASSVDSYGPITSETHPVHIDVEVRDIEEGEDIGQVPRRGFDS